MNDKFIDMQISNLADALVRNINDNFISVSFDILNNGHIYVKIILEKYTEVEKEYIEDISGEFTASQESDIVEEFEVIVDKKNRPLKYLVFRRK